MTSSTSSHPRRPNKTRSSTKADDDDDHHHPRNRGKKNDIEEEEAVELDSDDDDDDDDEEEHNGNDDEDEEEVEAGHHYDGASTQDEVDGGMLDDDEGNSEEETMLQRKIRTTSERIRITEADLDAFTLPLDEEEKTRNPDSERRDSTKKKSKEKSKDSDSEKDADEEEKKEKKKKVKKKSDTNEILSEVEEDKKKKKKKAKDTSGDDSQESEKTRDKKKNEKESEPLQLEVIEGSTEGKREGRRTKTPSRRRTRSCHRKPTAATDDALLSSPESDPRKQDLIEKAKEEAKKQMMERAGKGGATRIRVVVRKKGDESAPTTPARKMKISLSGSDLEEMQAARAASLSPMKSPLESSTKTKSDKILERALARKATTPSLDSHLNDNRPKTPRRGRRTCASLSGAGFNPNNIDTLLADADEAEDIMSNLGQGAGRDVLYREDRQRNETEWGGVVEDILRGRRDNEKSPVPPDAGCMSSPNGITRKTPGKNRSYSNLGDTIGRIDLSNNDGVRKSPKLVSPKRLSSGADLSAMAMVAQSLTNGGGSDEKETGEDDEIKKAPGRSKSFGLTGMFGGSRKKAEKVRDDDNNDEEEVKSPLRRHKSFGLARAAS